MAGYSINIEDKTLENENFREVLYTAPQSQLVVMTLKPGEEIGLETHDDRDQFIRVEEGEGVAILDGEKHALEDGTAVVATGTSAAAFAAPFDSVWIDLTKEHYGIHGTSAPETIGRAQSHGCVNLSPADAEQLFEFASPRLPSGWTAALPTVYEQGSLVRVR